MSRCGSLRWARRIGSVALAIDLAVWAQLRACGSDSAHHRRSAVELAGSMYAGDLPADHPRVSPLFADLADLPPIVILNGMEDPIITDGRRMCAWY